MAKSKSALAVLHAKRHSRPKSKVSANRRNIYEALELEEPYEYFPLLELPRELRDRIFEYLAVQQDDVSGSVITASHILRFWPAEIITTTHRLRVRSLSPQRPRDRFPPVLGALALSAANKQMHAEFQDAIARIVPHHVYSYLIDEPNVWRGREFSIDEHQFFSPRIHKLVIENGWIEEEECCGGRGLEVQSVADRARTRLRRRLRPCSATLEDVVVDMCQGGAGAFAALGRLFDVDVLQDTVVSFIESLPAVKRYAVRTCRTVTYARRCKGQAWGGDEVYREQGFWAKRVKRAKKAAEITGFLEEMGVKDLYLL